MKQNYGCLNNQINNLDEIQNLISLGESRLTKEKQAVIVIGDTGEGKSTLINYIAQNKLYAEKKGYPAKYIVNADNQLGDIKIGNTSVSETTIPNKWIDKDGVAYWDCPGFGDTKGVVQDVANAFYIKKLFDNIENIKVVVVVSEDTIGGSRADKFLNLLKKLGNLFVNLDSLKDSLSLVITKASISDVTAFKKFLSEELIPQQTEYLNQKQKSLLEFFASTKSRIGFFESPKSVGEIDLSNSVQIKQVISNAEYLNKPAINVTVSNQSLLELEIIAKDINQNINLLCKEVNNDVFKKCKKILQDGIDTKTIRTDLHNLLFGIKSLNQNNKDSFIESYTKLCQQFSLHNHTKIFNNFLELLDFIKLIKSDIIYGISSWFSALSVQETIDTLCSNIESDYVYKTKELYIRSNILSATDIMSKVRENNYHEIKSVKAFAFEIFYLDADLINRGKNTSIISPTWKISSQKVINLKGTDGINYLIKADNSYGNNNKDGLAGQDGLPGKPGGSGGNFFGYRENLIGNGILIIDVSGGNGSKGQDSGNGSNGQNGKDANSYVGFNSNRCTPTIVYEDSLKTISRILYYNSGEEGGIGGNSGKGGTGGIGGYPGKVKCNFSCKIISEIGKNGDYGLPGQPGSGGKRGDDFNRYYEDWNIKALGFLGTFGIGGMITTGKSDWEGSSYRDTSDKKAKSGERLWSENSREILKPPAPDYSFLEAMNNTNPANLLNIEKTKIKKTLFDTILCGFNIKQQDYNLSEYNQGFYKYTLNAVSYILELRIIDLQLKNMKVLQAIFIDQNYNNISDILTQISTSTEKLTLVPVNLYNKHAVGIIFEKDKYTNMIHVKYLDSLNKHMSQELKQFITHTLDSQVDFQEITVEQQKYANCGSQVIENFIFYLTGHKVSQEKAIELHSKLVENTLLNNNISEVYLMFEQQFNSFKFATSSEQIEHTPDLFYNVDCNNLQLEVAGEINSFY